MGLCVLGLSIGIAQILSPESPSVWDNAGLSRHLAYALKVLLCGWFGFGFALCLIQPALKHRAEPGRANTPFIPVSSRQIKIILFVVLIWTRVTWWYGPPSPSEDVWRYIWDGERLTQGQSIYSIPPSELRGDDTDLERIRSRIGHAHIPTVYPPGAEVCFAISSCIGALFGGSLEDYLFAWRLILLLAELALLASLLSIIQTLGRDPLFLFPYVLCPHSAFESALSAHLDIIGVALMIYAIAEWVRGRRGFVVGAALGGATLVKFIPLIPFTVMILDGLTTALYSMKQEERSRARFHLIRMLTGALVAGCILTYPVLNELIDLGGLWPGLTMYKEHWYFNGSLFTILQTILGVYPISMSVHEAHQWAQTTLGLSIAAAVCLYSWHRFSTQIKTGRERTRVDHAFLVIELSTFGVSLLLLCSPVVFGWYLLWIIPLSIVIALHDQRSTWIRAMAFTNLIWAFLSAMTYFPRLELLRSGEWSFSPILIFIEYGTLTLTLVLIKRYTLPVASRHSSPIQTLDIE